MKLRIYILTLVSVFSLSFSFAQKGKIKAAEKQYENLSYKKSTDALLKLVEEGNANGDVYQKLANAYYFNGQMENAVKWYKELFFLGKEIELESYYRYAQALKGIGEYFKSDEIMEKFSELHPADSRAIAFTKSRNYLDMIENISDDYVLENLDFNTSYSDFGAAFYGTELYFASSREEKDDIYQWNQQPFLNIYRAKEGASEVVKIQGDVNSKYHESSAVFTKDGKTMYFTRNNFFKGNFKKSNEDIHGLKIYKATLVDSLWTNIVSLPFNNDDYNVAHPALSVDEKKLYFASDMFGTQGSSDIFVADINEDGTYGEPLNLGPKVNTEGRENFPFVSEKGILYFSSDGHVGLGGLDVFKVELDKLNETSILIQNLGKPINSSKDDFGFIINETSGKGFISSNREGGKGDDDIYSFVKPPCSRAITGTVLNKRTSEVLSNADVFVYDSSRNLLKSLKSDDSGKFTFDLSCNERTYLIEAKKDKFKDDFTDFSIKPNEETSLKLELKLDPAVAKVGTDLALLLNLNPIYFDYDKSFIRPDAEIELAKVINYMKEYPNVKVDVRSHTDSRGRDAYNWALSNRRNKSTREYIINKGGISAGRLSGQGYGETRLTNRCTNAFKSICSEAEHQANRRSEFIVVEN